MRYGRTNTAGARPTQLVSKTQASYTSPRTVNQLILICPPPGKPAGVMTKQLATQPHALHPASPAAPACAKPPGVMLGQQRLGHAVAKHGVWLAHALAAVQGGSIVLGVLAGFVHGARRAAGGMAGGRAGPHALDDRACQVG